MRDSPGEGASHDELLRIFAQPKTIAVVGASTAVGKAGHDIPAYLQSQGRHLPITPGMMTDTQIITGRKSVLSYLLKPVMKARSDALRER